MSVTKVSVHLIVKLLRVVVGSFAALLAFSIVAFLLIEPPDFKAVPWHKALFYAGFMITLGSLSGALAYGLLHMRDWVIYVVRAFWIGILLWCWVVLLFASDGKPLAVLTSGTWLTGQVVAVVLGLFDALLRKHQAFFGQSES